ncbi:MAG: hypothetical protein AAF928_08810 [Myxococcota bacterium]
MDHVLEPSSPPSKPSRRVRRRRPWALPLVGLGLLGFASAGAACGSDEEPPPTDGGDCTPTDPNCPGLGSACLALTDNAGLDEFTLRLAQLSVLRPASLTTDFVRSLIADGVNANLDACNLFGMGSFNLMVTFDRPADTLTLGGAFPEQDPTQGYCLVDDPDNDVAPVTVAANLQDDGSFSTDPIDRFVVPVFIDTTATEAVYLPLRQARITGGQLSADQNCVGRFNADGLQPDQNCAPFPEMGIEYFVNDAELDGFIRIEEADEVSVDLARQSLCVLLSGDVNAFGDGNTEGIERCRRDGDGEIVLEGDWCSTSNQEGDCRDSFKLQGRVAASAATLRATSDCPAR